MTLSHENKARNGMPGQNHMTIRYYTTLHYYIILASIVEQSYLILKYLAAILFSTLEMTFDLEDDLGSPK